MVEFMKKLKDRMYPKWRHAVSQTPSSVPWLTWYNSCVRLFALEHRLLATNDRPVCMHCFRADPAPHAPLCTTGLHTSALNLFL